MAKPTTKQELEATYQTSIDLNEDLDKLVTIIGNERAALDRFNAMMPAEARQALDSALKSARKAVKLVIAQLEVEFPEE